VFKAEITLTDEQTLFCNALQFSALISAKVSARKAKMSSTSSKIWAEIGAEKNCRVFFAQRNHNLIYMNRSGLGILNRGVATINKRAEQEGGGCGTEVK
jgi:hypothetical protein